MRRYIDKSGRRVAVSCGISCGCGFMTCRAKKSGSLQRIKSKYLPIRKTRQEAQEDLDAYAEKHGWPLDVETDEDMYS